MDKNAIKNYAIYARNKLIQSTKDKAATIGITEKNISLPVSKGEGFEVYTTSLGTQVTLNNKEIEDRKNLISKIKRDGYNQTIEEVAYTWFNRLIAIRFMEVNDYLASRVRALSSEIAGRTESDLMIDPFSADFEYTEEEYDLINKYKDNSDSNSLFKLLFIKQCEELGKILPGLFTETEDYTKLLFNIQYNDKEDVVYKLVNEIPESNFNVEEEGQVEIIGWMYQYYNTELKAKVDNYVKKGNKVIKEDLPAKTQIFTPDWIVKYMVENSLGRLWLDGHEDSIVKSNWRYYLDETEQEESVQIELNKIKEEHSKLNVEDIKIIDPCMGSGHILVYAFDVLMQIYESQGWDTREAAVSILENNLYGLDIDERAYQLAYFALMMKAKQYNSSIFNKNIVPNVLEIKESNNFDRSLLDLFEEQRETALKILNVFNNAKEYGSILNIKFTNEELKQLEDKYNLIKKQNVMYDDFMLFKNLLKQSKIMSQKYEVVITNPPYMGSSYMNISLISYVKKWYPNTKSDLSIILMEKAINIVNDTGYISMINIPTWMFIASYEKFRNQIIKENTIINMIHLGRGIFGADFGTTSFVLNKHNIANYIGHYNRLFDKQGEVNSVGLIENYFILSKGLYYTKQIDFLKIPGNPIAYWISNNMLSIFRHGNSLSTVCKPVQGLATGDNNRFIRLWFEVDNYKISYDCHSCDESMVLMAKWFPYNKGGDYRKWYGNNQYIINWLNNGNEIKSFKGSVVRNPTFYFKECASWSLISSSATAFRYKNNGFIFDVAGMSFFTEDNLKYYLGFCNTKIAYEILKIIAPTINFQVGDIAKIPLIFVKDKSNIIENNVDCSIRISKQDWDSFETSWDFTRHPLLRGSSTIEESYNEWNKECTDRFYTLKSNEEELNRIFIDIYGLQDELTPDVEEKDVTVRKADLKRDIKSLISYAVGCMLGRYSLDEEGLAYAGGEWNIDKYKTYIPDEDNIIPITDEYYFDDDIVGRFIEFIRVAYGNDTLEENLRYIADALGNSGSTSREVIRNYFIKDFYNDHLQTYQVTGSGKRPIYWLFDSGKQNGFKALIYMHRYNEDTVGKIRTDYLHKIQEIYEESKKQDEFTIDNSSNKTDITKARKHVEKLNKQINETKIYEQALAHIANQRISIDLDDGVKVNYAKFQGVEVINEGSKTIKVDLLYKIK